jgi:hypothetical protein
MEDIYMTTYHSTQQMISECEQLLKTKHGYTTKSLEQIGLDCPTALDYLERLCDKLDELSASDGEDVETLHEITD